MTQNHLELTGSFRSNTFAELVIEISQATLTGSLRCSAGDKKSVFYVDGGSPVFCVSNSRNFRLSEILVSENNIDRGSLKKYSGISNDLITRAADVILKERRKLICVVRDTPYNLIHIKNMETVTLAGGIICPATPSFYSKPTSIEAVALTVVDRVLDLAGFDSKSFRWGGEA